MWLLVTVLLAHISALCLIHLKAGLRYLVAFSFKLATSTDSLSHVKTGTLWSQSCVSFRSLLYNLPLCGHVLQVRCDALGFCPVSLFPGETARQCIARLIWRLLQELVPTTKVNLDLFLYIISVQVSRTKNVKQLTTDYWEDN